MKVNQLYIGSASCVSVQDTFDNPVWYNHIVALPAEQARVKAPDYKQYLDPMATRRMSKVLKNALLTAKQAMDRLSVDAIDGVITATAWGCQEDTLKFLDSFETLGEELLSPTAFIQSTHNTIGGLIAMSIKCNGYNNTISHDLMSFETALLDAVLLMKEQRHPMTCYVGGVDELIDFSAEIFHRTRCYHSNYTTAEGTTCFLLHNTSTQKKNAALTEILLSDQEHFDLEDKLAEAKPDLILAYSLEKFNIDSIPVFEYKKWCGEYATASAFALFLAFELLQKPDMIKALGLVGDIKLNKIAIVNQYQYNRCSYIEVQAC
jgi:3-oxoacyl-[acyl-carrier-protein] synthase II